jgi:hypothetical protein
MTPWQQVTETASKMGYPTYQMYLESDHWAWLKKRKGYQPCCVCGSKENPVHHHIRYKNLIDVEPVDLVCMCRSCHDDFHMACRHSKWDYIGMEVGAIVAVVNEVRAQPFYAKWQRKKARKAQRRAGNKAGKAAKSGIRCHIRRFLKEETTRASIEALCKKLMGYSQTLPPTLTDHA